MTSKKFKTNYTLIAHNEQGASIEFSGDTQIGVLQDFDHVYSRRGFMIKIVWDGGEKVIKSTTI